MRTLVAIVLAATLGGAAVAHGGGSGGGPHHGGHHGSMADHHGPGSGMMGSGMMGSGMMGPGMMGPRMMGPRMMGSGMMGSGMMELAGLPDAERERLRELHAEHAGEHFDHMLALGEARRGLHEAMRADPPDPETVGEAYDRVAEVRREMLLSSLRFREAVREALPEGFQEQMQERMRGYHHRGMGPDGGPGEHHREGMGQDGMMDR